MPTIVYFSLTGNTKAFAERFLSEGFDVTPVGETNPSEPFTLFTPTYNFGKVPRRVKKFLEFNLSNLSGVVAFGNRNWGENFGKSGDILAEQYSVPLLRKVEMRGTDEDFNAVRELLLIDGHE